MANVRLWVAVLMVSIIITTIGRKRILMRAPLLTTEPKGIFQLKQDLIKKVRHKITPKKR